MKKIIVLAAVFLMIFPFSSFAEKSHNMAGIQFETPDGWTPSVKRYTVTIEKKDRTALLMVTNMPLQNDVPDLSEIEDQLRQSGKRLLRNSVERDLKIQKFDRGEVKGNYFTLTDRAPKPGEYKLMTEGAVVSDRVFLIFTLLYNEAHDPSEEAFAMIASMKPGK